MTSGKMGRSEMIPTKITRRNRYRFPGFYDKDAVRRCWKQTSDHEEHFVSNLKCPKLCEYHTDKMGCELFDDMVQEMPHVGAGHRENFFNYYKITGTVPHKRFYLKELVQAQYLSKFNLGLVRIPADELNGNPPRNYNKWPSTFEIDSFSDANPQIGERNILLYIERCIRRRLRCRNTCVVSCNGLIDTATHDKFVLILQILRARIILLRLPGRDREQIIGKKRKRSS